MKTFGHLKVKLFYLFSILVVVFSMSCSISNLHDDTKYNEFAPNEVSHFFISFEYPEKWQWDVDERNLITPPADNVSIPGYSQFPFGAIWISVDSFPTENEAIEYASKSITDEVNYSSKIDPLFTVENLAVDNFLLKKIAFEFPRQREEKEPSLVERHYLVVGN